MVLAETVAGRFPATALDVCCGMGADAIWLTRQGWKVTAIDQSSVALERARADHPRHGLQGAATPVIRWGLGDVFQPLRVNVGHSAADRHLRVKSSVLWRTDAPLWACARSF